MTILRRIVLMLSAFLLLAFVTVVLLAPNAVRDFADSISDTALIVRLLLIILMYAGVLGFAYWQFRNLEHSEKGLVVRSQGANMSLTVESARERILETIRDVRGVRSVKADIKPVRGRADIHLKVTVASSDTNLLDEQKHITRALEQVVKKQLGLRMAGRPNVELTLGGVASEAPAAKAPAAAAPEPAPAKATDEKKPAQGGVFGGVFGRKKDEEFPSPANEADARPANESNDPAVPAAKPAAPKAAGEDDLSEDDFFAMLESTIPADENDDSTTSAEVGQQAAPAPAVADGEEDDEDDVVPASFAADEKKSSLPVAEDDADDDVDDMVWLDQSTDDGDDPADESSPDSDDDETPSKGVGSAWE